MHGKSPVFVQPARTTPARRMSSGLPKELAPKEIRSKNKTETEQRKNRAFFSGKVAANRADIRLASHRQDELAGDWIERPGTKRAIGWIG